MRNRKYVIPKGWGLSACTYTHLPALCLPTPSQAAPPSPSVPGFDRRLHGWRGRCASLARKLEPESQRRPCIGCRHLGGEGGREGGRGRFINIKSQKQILLKYFHKVISCFDIASRAILVYLFTYRDSHPRPGGSARLFLVARRVNPGVAIQAV